MTIICLFCNKIYINKNTLKTHYINNTCKSDLLNNQLNLHNHIKHIIMYSLINTCLFCNTVYSRKYNFERHLSNNCCKYILGNKNDQYKLYNCVLSIINQNKKFENEKVEKQNIENLQEHNKIQTLEKIDMQKIKKNIYLKQWKKNNKDKVQLYRLKYKAIIKNYIETCKN